jgi:cobalt/nickel transport system permease protein
MTRRRPSTRGLVAGALVLAVAIAFLVAPRASTAPDGLERVAADQGIDAAARPHPLGAGPLGGDRPFGPGSPIGTGAAATVGIACCFLAATGLAALRRRRRTDDRAGDPGDAGAHTMVADAAPGT